jgi:hypothetical protein
MHSPKRSRPQGAHPPFPFVRLRPEHRLPPAVHRTYRIRRAVWVLLILGVLAWLWWPVEPEREWVDVSEIEDVLPY